MNAFDGPLAEILDGHEDDDYDWAADRDEPGWHGEEDPPHEHATAEPESRVDRLRRRVLTIDQLATLPPLEYLVPGVLPRRGLGFLYGPSGHGKSFVALDMGLSVAAGIAYAGRPVIRADVLYVVAEGTSGVSKRIDAWRAHNPHADLGARFRVLPEAVNLADPNGVDTGALAAICEEFGSRLVIVDTMARAMTGFDENSARDMGVFVANAELVAKAIDGLVLPVHHTGKDVTKGMRGNTAAYGGADVVIECTRVGQELTLKCPKLKDDDEFPSMRFLLTAKAGSLALEYQDGLYVPAANSDQIAAVLRVIFEHDDGTGVPGKLVEDTYQSTTGRGRSDYHKAKKRALELATVRNVGSVARPRFSLTSAGFDFIGEESP